MKKQLLCTSAIALGVAAAAPATAQDWDVNWGGFYSNHIGFANVSNTGGADFDGLNIVGNAEIIFSPSVTLDNGLTFSANVQLEGQNFSNIDESYVQISGDSLGRVIIGGENSVGYLMLGWTPGVGIPIISNSSSAFIPFSGGTASLFRQAMGSSHTEVGGNNDTQRISYITPSFNGFSVGVSYAPTGNTNAGNGVINRNAVGSLIDVFDIAASYSQSMGSGSFSLAARYGEGTLVGVGPAGADLTPSTMGASAQFSANGFTVGLNYAENDTDVAGGLGSSEGFGLGMTYDIPGPWTVGFTGWNGSSDTGAGPDIEYNSYSIGASRSLGTGVNMSFWAVYAENDDNNAATADLNGTAIGMTLGLSF